MASHTATARALSLTVLAGLVWTSHHARTSCPADQTITPIGASTTQPAVAPSTTKRASIGKFLAEHPSVQVPAALMSAAVLEAIASLLGGGLIPGIAAVTIAVWSGVLAAVRLGSTYDVAQGLRREVHTHRQDLMRQALHDPLTGQASRPLFTFCVDTALQNAGPSSIAVLMCDLNAFKSINDDLGHTVGDSVLCQVAWRLNRQLPPGATLARTGGDEFGVLLEGLSPDDAHQAAEMAASELTGSLHEPVIAEGRPVPTEITIGMVVVRPELEDIDVSEVLRRADIALQTARRADSPAPVLYTEGLTLPDAFDWQMRPAVAQALRDGAILPYYQPVVDLATGRVHALEALARWEQPPFGRGGAKTPDTFLPVITRSGLLPELTERMLLAAAAQRARWQEQLPPAHPEGLDVPQIRITINVSPASIVDPSFPMRVHQLLSERGLNAEGVIMEITEEKLMEDLPTAESVLLQLKEMGIATWLDDFGAGYSSLAMLHRLPLEAIKLDKGLVRTIDTDASLRRLVGGLVALGQDLGLQVVAEGIQRYEQMKVLRDLECPLGQGYLFSPPVPAHECPEVWARRGFTIGAPGSQPPNALRPANITLAVSDSLVSSRLQP